MPNIIEDGFYMDEYPEYKLVVQCILKIFLQANKEKKIKFMFQVDEYVGELLQTSAANASNLRKIYFNGDRNENASDCSLKHLKMSKVGFFDFEKMMNICKENGIDISTQNRDELLLFSTCALPVSEILNEKSKFGIHADFRVQIKAWIHEIDVIMKKNPNLKIILLKYLHKFRENELVWWLLSSLPSVAEGKVKHWIDSFGNIPSEKTILELIDSTEEYGYLLDFKNKFYRINEKNHKTVHDEVTGYDLLSAHIHIDNFKQLACTPLRPVDVYLTYLIAATIKHCPQELILEQIAAASKAKLAYNFASTEDIMVDWTTRTYIYI